MCQYNPNINSTMSLASGAMEADCVSGSYALGFSPFPMRCGYSYFVPLQPGVGFTGTKFEPTTEWVKRYQDQVKGAVALEVRSGYPRTSYVPLADKTTLPPQFKLCVE